LTVRTVKLSFGFQPNNGHSATWRRVTTLRQSCRGRTSDL